MIDWANDEELKQEETFWNEMGENTGYIDTECPNCKRMRVERWSCGKDICEKCHWCIQDNSYFSNEFFRY